MFSMRVSRHPRFATHTPALLLQKVRRRIRAAIGQPPPLLDAPEAALARAGEHAAYRCQVARCTYPIGFRLDSWNPFVETSRAMLRREVETYETSVLRPSYKRFQPRHAAEAIVGFDGAPPEFERWPPIVALCAPWESMSPAAMMKAVRIWNANDYSEGGYTDAAACGGHGYFGPVDLSLAEAEYDRLQSLTMSMSRNGYDRRYGDVSLIVLKRGEEYLGVTSGGGMHRTLVAAAVGIAMLPARPQLLADYDRIDTWPHVRSGLWSVEHAKAFCDHLFDFDFGMWAAAYGIR
jgi:hypothetical protein